MSESKEKLLIGGEKPFGSDEPNKGFEEEYLFDEYSDQCSKRARHAVNSDDQLVRMSGCPASVMGGGGDTPSGGGMTPSHMTEDMLQSQAQTLIEEVNRKRQRDTQTMEDYKNCQIQQVEKFCSQVENQLFETYKVQNKVVDEKIQRLFTTLERIAKLRAELEQFREVLNNLCKDLMPC